MDAMTEHYATKADYITLMSTQIEGLINAEEAHWLAEAALGIPHGVIVEIGSWKGRSTRVLGAAALDTGGVVFAVDAWCGSASEEADSLVNRVPGHEAFDYFSRANADLITAGYIVPLHTYSHQAARALARVGMAGQIDMLWVDGDHLYESVKADLDAWLPLVKPGGLVCGHDYGRDYLQRAVHEHFAPEVVGCDAGSIWYARMP